MSESISWRFAVEEILEGRRRKGFDSLEALCGFLRAELSSGDPDRPDGFEPWS